MRAWLRGGLGAVPAMLAGCHATPPRVDQQAQTLSMDELQDQLATRAKMRLGNSQDFQVIVTQAEYPVGTLMRQGSTIPVDFRACAPGEQPQRFGAPSLFPSFRLNNEAAAGIGLDNALLTKIADAGIKLSHGSDVTVSFQNTGLSVLSDNDLHALAVSAACSQALAGGTVLWMVRGYVRGQRQFALGATDTAAAHARLIDIGSFEVNPGSGSSDVEVSDKGDVGFLQIISEVSAPAAGQPPPPMREPASVPDTPPAKAGVVVDRPTVAVRTGRIYIQQDRTDATGRGDAVRAALAGVGSPVVQTIERIDSQKMPDTAQVRYFNVADAALARSALDRLRATFPDAKLVRIPLPAPSGQLEIWLQRTGAMNAAIRVGGQVRRIAVTVAPPPDTNARP